MPLTALLLHSRAKLCTEHAINLGWGERNKAKLEERFDGDFSFLAEVDAHLTSWLAYCQCIS